MLEANTINYNKNKQKDPTITRCTYKIFFWKELFKIYLLSNFQIYCTVLLTTWTMLYIIPHDLIILEPEVCTFWPLLPIFPTTHSMPLVNVNLFSVSMSSFCWFFFIFKKYLFLYLTVSSLHCNTKGLVPWLGIESWSPALGPCMSLSHWTTREVPDIVF